MSPKETIHVPVMSEMAARGESPEILFWVGCAGSFDERAQKISRAFAKILHHAGVKYAVLGTEESCTGDPAKRAGNEFLFQMQAMNNITILNGYDIKKIVTICPHCYNTLKNEYPSLGGSYEVVHHTQFLQSLIEEGKLKINEEYLRNNKLTFHDPCYLGRGNGVYEAPRQVIEKTKAEIKEMERSRQRGFCCGAGGAQMFKDAEKGNKEVNIERTEEALALNPDIIATACPFCMTMLSDGVKHFNKEDTVKVSDIAELIVQVCNL